MFVQYILLNCRIIIHNLLVIININSYKLDGNATITDVNFTRDKTLHR